MRRLTLFLCLLMPSLASAQPSGWNDPSICFLDGATGSFISIDGDSSFILSCAHGLKGVGSVCEGRSREGKQLRCQVVAMDDGDHGDVAILKFNGTATSPAKIADGPAPPGSRLTYCGFPMGGPLQTKALIARQGMGDLNIGDGSPIPGDSGGPVRNDRGEIVGTITGVSGGTGFYSKWKTVNRLVGEVRASGYVQTQCGAGGCGSCGPGGCPVYYNAQPAYRIEQRPPQVVQPQKPAVTSTPGPQGPAGPPGPPGPPGSNANCECGPKWADINARIDAIRVDVDASQTAITNLTTKVEGLSNRPAPPTAAEVAAEVEKNRKPARIRIVDPQGKYTTAYAEVRDGQDIDLIIEQRFTPAQQAP